MASIYPALLTSGCGRACVYVYMCVYLMALLNGLLHHYTSWQPGVLVEVQTIRKLPTYELHGLLESLLENTHTRTDTHTHTRTDTHTQILIHKGLLNTEITSPKRGLHF